MNRYEVMAQVISCTNCTLHERCTAPVHLDGPTPADIAVVGEAPNSQEDGEGKPFTSPPGVFLKEAMKEVGFDLDRVVFMNAVSCHPVDADTGNTRPPKADEIEACSVNLSDQLALANAGYVLLAGGVALKAVKPGQKLAVMRGVPFFMDGSTHEFGDRLGLVTYHPAYILRSGGKGSKPHEALMEDLTYLYRMVEVGPEDWIKLFPQTCLLCDEVPERYGDDAIGFCQEHWTP